MVTPLCFTFVVILRQNCDNLNNATFPTSAFVPLSNCPLEEMSRNAQRIGYANCFIVAVGGNYVDIKPQFTKRNGF